MESVTGFRMLHTFYMKSGWLLLAVLDFKEREQIKKTTSKFQHFTETTSLSLKKCDFFPPLILIIPTRFKHLESGTPHKDEMVQLCFCLFAALLL